MDALKIEIYDRIGKVFDWETWDYRGVNFDDVKEAIKDYKGDTIHVNINSEGGDILIAESIYSVLKGHDATVHTHVVGYAISAATIIMLAGDVVHMSENAYMMIHNPMSGVYGDVRDVDQLKNTLEVFTNKLAKDYSKKTGISINKIRKMMDDETWMDAKEAKKLGFVDKLTQGVNIAADLYSKQTFQPFKNVPVQVLNSIEKTNQNNSKIDITMSNIDNSFLTGINEKLESLQNTMKSFFSNAKNDKGEALDATEITNSLKELGDSVTDGFKAIENSIEETVKTQLNTAFENFLKDAGVENSKEFNFANFAKKEDIPNVEVLNKLDKSFENMNQTFETIKNDLAGLKGQSGTFNASGQETPKPADPDPTPTPQNSRTTRYAGKTEY